MKFYDFMFRRKVTLTPTKDTKPVQDLKVSLYAELNRDAANIHSGLIRLGRYSPKRYREALEVHLVRDYVADADISETVLLRTIRAVVEFYLNRHGKDEK